MYVPMLVETQNLSSSVFIVQHIPLLRTKYQEYILYYL